MEVTARAYGQAGYVGGDFPAIEMAELLGLYESSAMQEEVFDAVREDEIRMIREQFGAEVISYIYYPDQFIFSKAPLKTLDDFDGLKIRTHSTALGDLAAGLGAEGQFVAFSEVYTALERGVLDAGVTGSTPAYGQKWLFLPVPCWRLLRWQFQNRHSCPWKVWKEYYHY